MAHRIRNPLWARKRNQAVIKGSWQANGTSDVSLVQGTGFTVARVGVGDYTVTFDTGFPEMVAGHCGVQHSTGSGRYGQLGSYSASAKTLSVRVIDITGAGIDMSTQRVNFRAVMFNGTNGP